MMRLVCSGMLACAPAHEYPGVMRVFAILALRAELREMYRRSPLRIVILTMTPLSSCGASPSCSV